MSDDITAADISILLGNRHSNDVFIPQCKDGGSGHSFGQIDAWAMKTSWSSPALYGYEIKVSRNDFLRDTKWQKYLGMCNELYFVCPPKMIEPNEVPDECGLLWTTKNCGRLYSKKKAPFRKIDFPEKVFKYILMWRTKIIAEYHDTKTREDWEKWLAQRKDDQDFGHMLRGKLSKMVEEQITKVQIKSHILQEEVEQVREAKEILDKLGIDYNHSWRIEDQVLNAVQVLPPKFDEDLDDIKNKCRNMQIEIGQTQNRIKRLKRKYLKNGESRERSCDEL